MTIAGLPVALFAALALTVLGAAMLQRLAGQGLGMVSAPVMALLAPGHLPATLLLVGLLVGAGAISMDRSAVHWEEARWGFAGRALGAFAGAAFAVVLTDKGWFGPAVALIILSAIALNLIGLRAAITRASLVIAGVSAGIMGTMTAVGAPPMAILYANEETRRSRAMQNLFFAWGMAWSIPALALAGLVGREDVLLAAALAPFAAFGLILSRRLARRAAGWPMRPAALGIAGTAALALLWKSL